MIGGACSTCRVRKGVYKVLVGKPDGKRRHGRHGCRCEDNIKMNLQEVGYEGCGLIWFMTGTSGGHL